MNSRAKLYSDTVWSSKEWNLRRRAEIWRKYFLPAFLRAIWWEGFTGTIIEIGAGMGHKLRILQNSLSQWTIRWIEPSSEMRAYAEYLGSELSDGNITWTKLDTNSVDIAHIPQVWHHISREDYQKAIIEIKRILKRGWKVIVLDTFAPEDTVSRVERYTFAVANRAYAVLSQYPEKSLTVRTLRAVHSVLAPDKYNPEDFGYHSPKISDLMQLFIDAGFTYIQENYHTYWISKMLVFQKGDTP